MNAGKDYRIDGIRRLCYYLGSITIYRLAYITQLGPQVFGDSVSTQPERIRERETPIIGSVPPDRLFIYGSGLPHDTRHLPSSES